MKAATRKSAQAVILCLALMIFWVACVGAPEEHELLLGAAAALLSTAFSLYAIRQLPIRFRPTATDLLEGWRLPAYIAKDVAVVLWVLARHFAGRRAPSLFRSSQWRANQRSARDTARRTLAVAYATVSPNCVVLGIDRDRGQMLFHQIQATPVTAMTERLGAGDGK